MTIVVLGKGSHRDEDFGLDREMLSALWAMEDKHFWHVARNRWILRALAARGALASSRILDVGCGGGAVARALTLDGHHVTGVDTAEPLVLKAQERCPTADFFVGPVQALPAAVADFDIVTCCDVLEHVDHPGDLLRAACLRARPGALVLATVPASAALHTVVDDLIGHKRRYEVGELAACFSEAGLIGVQEHGIFRLTRGIQLVARRTARRQRADELSASDRRAILRNDLRVPIFLVNLALRLLCDLERAFVFPSSHNRAGASLLAVGIVPDRMP